MADENDRPLVCVWFGGYQVTLNPGEFDKATRPLGYQAIPKPGGNPMRFFLELSNSLMDESVSGTLSRAKALIRARRSAKQF